MSGQPPKKRSRILQSWIRDGNLQCLSTFRRGTPLVGSHGSGTVFLTHCNLRCIFCQNYDITHLGRGERITPLTWQGPCSGFRRWAVTILTSLPYPLRPQIVASIADAIEMGIRVPIVYNCSGYESTEVIRFLDGIVDIYMPDVKFMNEEYSKKFSNAPDYPRSSRRLSKRCIAR